MFAEILINLPVESTFWYDLGDFSSKAKKYERVRVVFSGEEAEGIIVNISDETGPNKLGKIISLIDKEPVFSDEQMEFARFISEYYTCTLSEAVFLMIPKGVRYSRKVEPEDLERELKLIDLDIKLTEEQEIAYSRIKDSFGSGKIFLLYGVTGSGKTEIYRKLVRDVLNKGRLCLLLVPEISLTPQLVDRFSFVPKEILGVYHSKLTDSERFNIYMDVMKGIKKFVIGARSSIFLPFNDLELIIVDEEHETSYKSSSTPRYSIRDLVRWLSRKRNITTVLGSATPLVESYYRGLNGEYELLKLLNRYSRYQEIEVEFVDMKKEKDNTVLSPKVLYEITNKLKENEQVLIFINRRGYSQFVMCENCGYVPSCPNCDVSLTYHKYKSSLECHHCGYKEKYSEVCKVCKSSRVKEIGLGTEKVEDVLRNVFHKYKVRRVDMDSMRGKESYDSLYKELKDGNLDIVVGTQIIAKGIDIPGINLVCVFYPEFSLRLPDFYASERTFFLISQAIGRAGRREKKGKAIIQTYDTEHYSITTGVKQNYEEFYNEEIKRRENFRYPPFYYITRFIFRSEEEKKCLEIGNAARIIIEGIAFKKGDTFVSPLLPAPIKKISKNYRYQIIVKTKDEELLTTIQKAVYRELRGRKGVYIEIDRNPISIL
jgi:primosomal protein N' (replication factor Y) (superfamily II helicase)